MNIALLMKWILRLYQDDDSIWLQILHANYPSASDIFADNGNGGSQFWKNIHKIKHLFKLGARHVVVDGRWTMFWQDKWLGSEALSVKFPNLFVIAENQLMSVPWACADPNAVRFRRSLCPRLRAEWVELVAFLNGVQLGTDRDRIVWDLEPSGVFSVKSMYAKLSQGASVAHFKDIWEAKLP
jgi:hypothetical protein